MKAVHIKPGKIIEYAGEMHVTPDVKREVDIIQFISSFWGSKAICKVDNVFEEIPIKELKWMDLEKEKEYENESSKCEFHTI